MLVACDIGKNMVKLAYHNTIESFPSILYSYEELNLTNKLRRYDFIVEYNGEKYIGGNLAHDEGVGAGYFNSDISKDHDETLINLLLALSLTSENVFDIVVGTPISKHTQDEKERLKRRFKGSHRIMINGIVHTFLINNVEVGPEGASAFFAHQKSGIVRGLDFGSTTVNYFSVDGHQKRFINKDSGTFNYGAKSYEGINVATKSKEVIANLKNKWSKDDYVMVLGGWGKEAYPTIKQYFTNTELLPNPLTATVEGLYKLGLMKYGR